MPKKSYTPSPSKPTTATTVAAVRRSQQTAGPVKRRVRAYSAAEASNLFPKGGPAFEKWCADQGIEPGALKTEAEWAPLIEQFAARPLHGHRRGPAGGNHRMNR